ncbi:MAG: hypothetical protein IPO66_00780 [Rhodanobacteraceae bacterium]|nr:hypothetical protein [Rhodanobacteraceae bacterium]
MRLLADVPAAGSARYRLRTDGGVANPAPAQPLSLSQIGAQWQVDTGVARFVLGASPARLFDRIEAPVGSALVDSSSLSATVDGQSIGGFASIRSIVVEHADALGAVLLRREFSSSGGGRWPDQRRPAAAVRRRFVGGQRARVDRLGRRPLWLGHPELRRHAERARTAALARRAVAHAQRHAHAGSAGATRTAGGRDRRRGSVPSCASCAAASACSRSSTRWPCPVRRHSRGCVRMPARCC